GRSRRRCWARRKSRVRCAWRSPRRDRTRWHRRWWTRRPWPAGIAAPATGQRRGPCRATPGTARVTTGWDAWTDSSKGRHSACWRPASGRWRAGLEREGGRRPRGPATEGLLGEDELVVARVAQAIALAAVADQQFALAQIGR